MTFYYFLVAAIIIIPIAQYCLIAGEFTKDLTHFYILFYVDLYTLSHFYIILINTSSKKCYTIKNKIC